LHDLQQRRLPLRKNLTRSKLFREEYEKLEKSLLSPRATLSSRSKGRAYPESKDPYRTPFQRDVDRILYSKSFRRLQYKTQVFIAPLGDHYRNRLTHTLEVMTISRAIARALRLNPDLTEAIALGHDLGHSPFGHAGEAVLNAKCKEYDPSLHFFHPEQSLRVVDVLERRIRSNGEVVFGLNLTFEVRDGILHHSKGLADLSSLRKAILPETLEGEVVRISDRIAYLHHDTDDAIRAGLIKETDIPEQVMKVLGKSNSKRLSTLILSVIDYSKDEEHIGMSDPVISSMDLWKNFLKERVYIGSKPKEEEKKVRELLSFLFDYFYDKPEKMEKFLQNHPISLKTDSPVKYLRENKKERLIVICDYLSSMTDRFAVEIAKSILFPNPLPLNY